MNKLTVIIAMSFFNKLSIFESKSGWRAMDLIAFSLPFHLSMDPVRTTKLVNGACELCTQWAAVSILVSLMIEQPQKWLPSEFKLHWYGNSPGATSEPPKIASGSSASISVSQRERGAMQHLEEDTIDT